MTYLSGESKSQQLKAPRKRPFGLTEMDVQAEADAEALADAETKSE